jgi:hypothetical protein
MDLKSRTCPIESRPKDVAQDIHDRDKRPRRLGGENNDDNIMFDDAKRQHRNQWVCS